VKVLLDTCTFLWLIVGGTELSSRARKLIRDPNNEVYLSSVSTWEIAVKHSVGRIQLPGPIESFIIEMRERHEIRPLELTEEATLQLPKLPDIHRDPFDRMLVCQAITHSLTLVTPDRHIQSYPARILW